MRVPGRLVAAALVVSLLGVFSVGEAGASEGGPTEDLCRMNPERGEVPSTYPLDGCVDGGSIWIRNQLAIPIRLVGGGDVRTVKWSSTDYSVAASLTRAIDSDQDFLLPGEVGEFILGAGEASVTTAPGAPATAYTLAKSLSFVLSEVVPGVGEFDTAVGFVREVDDAMRRYGVCLVGDNWLGQMGCKISLVSDINFAVAKALVVLIADPVDAVMGVLDYGAWVLAARSQRRDSSLMNRSLTQSARGSTTTSGSLSDFLDLNWTMYPIAGPGGEAVLCGPIDGRLVPVFRSADGALRRVRLPSGGQCNWDYLQLRKGIAWREDGVAFIATDTNGSAGVAALSEYGLEWHRPLPGDIPTLVGGGDGSLYALSRETSLFPDPDYLHRIDPATGAVLDSSSPPRHGADRFSRLERTETGVVSNSDRTVRTYNGAQLAGTTDLELGSWFAGGWSGGQFTAVSNDLLGTDFLTHCDQRIAAYAGGAARQLGTVSAPFERCYLWFADARPGGGLITWSRGDAGDGRRPWIVTWLDTNGEVDQQTVLEDGGNASDDEWWDIDQNGSLVLATTRVETCVVDSRDVPCNQGYVLTFEPDGDIVTRLVGTLQEHVHLTSPPAIVDSNVLIGVSYIDATTQRITHEIVDINAPELTTSSDRAGLLASS